MDTLLEAITKNSILLEVMTNRNYCVQGHDLE